MSARAQSGNPSIGQSVNRSISQSVNLYVHFPFCRRKCSYCALYSRVGVSQSDRAAYVRRLAKEIESLRVGLGSCQGSGKVGQGSCGVDYDLCRAKSQNTIISHAISLPTLTGPNPTLTGPNPTLTDSNPTLKDAQFKTVYFGGGSPALCDLSPLAPVLRPLCGEDTEFTVELHPLDVTESKLEELKDLGVNRISMGVQSLDDEIIASMGRGYTIDAAERAFALVKRHFDNAGIDLIVGYPGDEVEKRGGGRWNLQRLSDWGLRHCSVYSLQNERGLKDVPDDDAVLDRLRNIALFLREIGLERYEISNYAVPGFECRHNQAVWRGEDYIGLGEGACGRIGLKRTIGRRNGISESFVTVEEDRKERTIFRLRTREGLDASGCPAWGQALRRHVETGLLTQSGSTYRLTDRGTEVCDSILMDLV